jgi:hypothetical protein
MYAVAGKRSIVYLTDSSTDGGGMRLGIKGVDSESGIVMLNCSVIDAGVQNSYEAIGTGYDNEVLAQRFFSVDTLTQHRKIDKIRLRLSRIGAGTSYTIKVGIQAESTSATEPSGTYLASGTVSPSSVGILTGPSVYGQDVYVTLNTPVTLTPGVYWVVVEPTVIGDMTGTNSFGWYRSDGDNTAYASGTALAYDGASWALADDASTSESYDFGLLLANTEAWYPNKDYDRYDISTASTLAYDTSATLHQDNNTIAYDSTHVINAWEGSNNDGFVQVFSYTPTTGALAEVGTALEFDTSDASDAKMVLIDSTHFAMVWVSTGAVKAQVFAVDGSYAITAVGSAITVAASGNYPNIAKLSSTKVLMTYADSAGDGQAIIGDISGSYVITTSLSSALEFEDDNMPEAAQMHTVDSTHCIVAWPGTDNDGFMRTLGIGAAADYTHANLVSHWKFDESSGNAADSVGSNTLTNNNTATYAAGLKNNAAHFESGSSQYFSITDASQSGLDFSTTLSFMCRIRFDSLPTASNVHEIMSKFTVSGNQMSYHLFLYNNGGTYELTVGLSSGGGAPTGQQKENWTPTLGQWYSVGFTYKGSTTEVKLYLDGTQLGTTKTTNVPASLANVSAPFIIGSYQASTGFFDGDIDEAYIFSATLTDAEMLSVHNSSLQTPSFAAAELEFDTDNASGISVCQVDSTHILVAYRNSSAIVARTYSVDGSYVLAAAGSKVTIDTDIGGFNSVCVRNLTGDKYIIAYSGVDSDGFVVPIVVDPTTYEIEIKSERYEFDTTFADGVNVVSLTPDTAAVFYEQSPNDDGKAVVLRIQDTNDTDSFYVEEGQRSFISLADNGYLYWFVGSSVHSIDGGSTGDDAGVFSRDVILFPSYIECIDAVDKGGYLHIAISSTTTDSSSRMFSASTCGVYIWDRLSTVARTRDYYALEGVREVKKIFLSKTGDVMLITVGNSGFCEIRKMSNGSFPVVQKFEKLGYPKYRSSVSMVDGMVTWQGANGIIYAYGAVETGNEDALFKIGNISGNASGTFASGVTYTGGTTALATYQSWRDGTTNKLSKWYPNGEGTISSVVQVANAGNVYYPVTLLPALSTVNHINIYNLPIPTSDATAMGTLKIFFNQSATAWATKSITKADLAKGVKFIPVNKQYVNSVQIQVIWDTSATLGDENWYPVMAEIDYTPTTAINR